MRDGLQGSSFLCCKVVNSDNECGEWLHDCLYLQRYVTSLHFLSTLSTYDYASVRCNSKGIC